MAKASDVATVTVRIVPDLSGFPLALRAELITLAVEARWEALRLKVDREGRAEMYLLSRALDYAELCPYGWV